MENEKEIFDFYNGGAEIGRLENGLGMVEFYRSKEIISRYIDKACVVYDIGGGVGKYSEWLAENGHTVTMVELAPAAVEYAVKNMKTPYTALAGDARDTHLPDSSADAVLIMGPLYHLQSREDRNRALGEAYRVLKSGGLLIAAGISRYSTAVWALSKYGGENNFIDDDIYLDMLRREIDTGVHIRPKEYPFFIADAYFHTTDELEREMRDNGFDVIGHHAVEGSVWLVPKLDEKWREPRSRERLLELIRSTENVETMMGMSPHFLAIGKKRENT